ncbi:MAG TPA: heavy metal translocating P-type ATPase [Candidatus Saccharimonadales bacterium]
MQIILYVIGCIIVSLGLQLAGYGTMASGLLTIFSLVIAAKLSLEMISKLRAGHYGVDILAIAAILSTIAVGEQWATIIIVLMLTGGEALEDYAAGRAKHELKALLDRAPRTAHKLTKTGTQTVPLAEVRVGDELLVKPGEIIPVDATLRSEVAELDESSLTGESLPVEYIKGALLLSGAINGSGAITIKAAKTSEESQFQQIIKLVTDAMSVQAPFVRLADRYAVPFTAISFLIAGIAWVVSGNPLRFAEVLVVATPCPLLLAAPIALVSGMSRAAKNGIIIKSGAILERLADIKAVAFDKTGTLTQGELVVKEIRPASGFTEHDLLFYAASAEQHSAHILTVALLAECERQNITLSAPTGAHETIAQGMHAVVKKKKVYVGKATFLATQHITVPKASVRSGETVIYIAIGGVYAGAIIFSDHLRAESKNVMQHLQALGVTHTIMVTGDSKSIAERIAKAAGITDVFAERLPADKVAVVRDMKVRPVMMVGDGVNDAPVLAAADVGMAMGARGSSAASETADVVVLVDNIAKSAQAIQIAKTTIRIALESVWLGIAISIVLMIIAAFGVIPAIVGAFLQEAVDVLVILNALRAHGTWK